MKSDYLRFWMASRKKHLHYKKENLWLRRPTGRLLSLKKKNFVQQNKKTALRKAPKTQQLMHLINQFLKVSENLTHLLDLY